MFIVLVNYRSDSSEKNNFQIYIGMLLAKKFVLVFIILSSHWNEYKINIETALLALKLCLVLQVSLVCIVSNCVLRSY